MAQKNDQPPASPTLIPALPSPIPPTTSSAATSEELSFFDRAKKAISNKNTFNEFLKLCNLFSQDLVDRTVLVHRARSFIGTNPELMKWFQDFIGYDEKDVIVDNKARIPGGRVSLSNCRGLGPSYRLLPKRVRYSFFSLPPIVFIVAFCLLLSGEARCGVAVSQPPDFALHSTPSGAGSATFALPIHDFSSCTPFGNTIVANFTNIYLSTRLVRLSPSHFSSSHRCGWLRSP